HAVERALGEVATRQVAAHQLHVDEPGAREVLARMPGADDAGTDHLAVVVELQSGEFRAVGLPHAAILAADVATRHAPSPYRPLDPRRCRRVLPFSRFRS